MPTGADIHPTSTVSSDAELGAGVKVGPYCAIEANVSVGEGSFVGSHVVLGAATANYHGDPDSYEPARCEIGKGAVIRSHSIVYAGASVGESQAGIAELTGDTLKVCMAAPGKPRPSDFSSKAGDGRSYTTWRFAKK